MKSLLCLLALLLLTCSPQYAAACPPVAVQSQGVVVQSHCAPVAVQALGVPVQSYAVQSVQVQAVPVQVFAVDHCGGAVVQRSVVVQRQGLLSRIRARRAQSRSLTIQRTIVR